MFSCSHHPIDDEHIHSFPQTCRQGAQRVHAHGRNANDLPPCAAIALNAFTVVLRQSLHDEITNLVKAILSIHHSISYDTAWYRMLKS